MRAFFAVAGSRIAHGDCSSALRALRQVPGLEPRTIWDIVDGWQAWREVERLTGWTPEVAAMEVVMRSTNAWRDVDWVDLLADDGSHEDDGGDPEAD